MSSAPSSMEDSRQAFEKWCASVHEPEHLMERDENGHYISHIMFCQFQAWQAARTTTSPTAWRDEVVRRLEAAKWRDDYCSECQGRNSTLEDAIAIVRETPIEGEVK